MRYHEACEAQVTLTEAMAEFRKHGIAAHVREGDNALLNTETGELIAEPDEHGEYYGGDVIAALGY